MSTKNWPVQTLKFVISVFVLVGLLLPAGPALAQSAPRLGRASALNAIPSNNVLSLDGVDDYATAPDNASLDLGTGSSEDFTIETFFYIPDHTSRTTDFLISKAAAYSLYIIYADMTHTTQDRIVFKICYSPLTDRACFGIYYDLTLTVGWHHVAAVYDNEYTASHDLLALYLDGNQVQTDGNFDLTPGLYNSALPVEIGDILNGNVYPFKGWMDEVRFSNIVRYSGSYVVPTAPFVSDGNTRALWHFDEAAGATTFFDSSGHSNTLTGFNGAKTIGQVIISGNAGAPGVVLSYTDGAARTVTSGNDGGYSLQLSNNWSGTVTPSHPCYTFNPLSRSYSNVTSDKVGQNFTAIFNNSPVCGVTVGVFRPSNGLIYLKNSNTSGFADVAINYGMGGDYPIAGDWDGDGVDTIGVYRSGGFYLRNSNTVGIADINFAFGTPGDQPIAGDWNHDGVDTVGIYRSSTFTFYLRNSNSAGAPDMIFSLGIPGDVGIAGDWDGDGFDTTGVFRPSNGVIFLKNTNQTGYADIAINYGIGGDKPITGDWNNDGIDTIGVLRGNVFYLRNSNTVGYADMYFALGIPGDMPIAGNWDGIP